MFPLVQGPDILDPEQRREHIPVPANFQREAAADAPHAAPTQKTGALSESCDIRANPTDRRGAEMYAAPMHVIRPPPVKDVASKQPYVIDRAVIVIEDDSDDDRPMTEWYRP
jgi:hypothetical protein